MGRALLSLIILWLVGFAAFFIVVSRMTPPPVTEKTDAIVVLTGGSGRINTGLDLLAAGASDKLFVSGVGPRVTVSSLLSLWNAGKSPCCVTLGHHARNTEENATETAEWAQAQHIHSLRLVTAAYHMPRAEVDFHAAMPNVAILPSPSPLAPGYEESHLLQLTFLEYNKTIYAWFRSVLSGAPR